MIWLLVGTIFYSEHDFGRSYAKGFYYAVNVGYSIDFGVLQLRGTRAMRNESYAFSIFYILCGSVAMVNLISSIFQEALAIPSQKMWYTSFQAQQLTNPNRPWKLKIRRYVLQRLDHFQRIAVWLLYIVWGTAWSCSIFGWNAIEGLYFSISSLSTGGLYGIPKGADEFAFFVVGLFCCTGVPVMGLGLSSLTALIMERAKKGRNDLYDIKTAGNMNTPQKETTAAQRRGTAYSKRELEMYEQLLSVPSTGLKMTKESFVLLNLIRRGAVDRAELQNVMANFDSIFKEQRSLIGDDDDEKNESINVDLAETPP